MSCIILVCHFLSHQHFSQCNTSNDSCYCWASPCIIRVLLTPTFKTRHEASLISRRSPAQTTSPSPETTEPSEWMHTAALYKISQPLEAQNVPFPPQLWPRWKSLGLLLPNSLMNFPCRWQTWSSFISVLAMVSRTALIGTGGLVLTEPQVQRVSFGRELHILT